MRRGLHRRRSSFPPAVGSSVTGANSYPWVIGGTPPVNKIGVLTQDILAGFGNEIGPNGISSPGAWESLLNFDSDEPSTKAERPLETSVPSVKVESDAPSTSPQVAKVSTPSKKSVGLERTASSSEAWRLAINRTVDVEGVGPVGVARILSEVWKRGGPAAVSIATGMKCTADAKVTSQGLWPSILMSLSLSPEPGTTANVGTPSSQAALSLQALYNVAVRPHETIVFAGLLSSYVASTAPPAVNAFQDGQVYGAWTPTKGIGEVELSQWTTFTPGEEWPSLSTTLPSGSGLTPRREFSPALGLPPIDILDSTTRPDTRPDSRGPADGITGIDAILAEMEEDERLRETESVPTGSISQPEWGQSNSSKQASPGPGPSTSDSDPFVVTNRQTSVASTEEPVENAVGSSSSTPHTSRGCMLSATSVSMTIPSVSPEASEPTYVTSPKMSRQRAPPSLQLPLPDVPFIPPPPMCMFFSPAFRDLQHGKVAVWKGDLVIRGRGGGRFNVLIIGETDSDKLW